MTGQEEMKKLLAVRSRAKGKYTRKHNMLQLLMKDGLAYQVIETKQGEVEEAFTQLEELNNQVLEKCEESDPVHADHVKFIDEVEIQYSKLLDEIVKYKEKGEKANFTCSIKKLDPPRFKGNSRNFLTWLKHYNMFVVPQRGNNAFVLLSCLEGEAYDAVAGLDDHVVMMKRLKEIYGDPQSILTSVTIASTLILVRVISHRSCKSLTAACITSSLYLA